MASIFMTEISAWYIHGIKCNVVWALGWIVRNMATNFGQVRDRRIQT